jgi:hypothetical protein
MKAAPSPALPEKLKSAAQPQEKEGADAGTSQTFHTSKRRSRRQSIVEAACSSVRPQNDKDI